MPHGPACREETWEAETGSPPHGKAFGRARQWGILKGNSWRCTGGTWLLPQLLGLERGGEGEGGLGKMFCLFEISRAQWVRMKYPRQDSEPRPG